MRPLTDNLPSDFYRASWAQGTHRTHRQYGHTGWAQGTHRRSPSQWFASNKWLEVLNAEGMISSLPAGLPARLRAMDSQSPDWGDQNGFLIAPSVLVIGDCPLTGEQAHRQRSGHAFGIQSFLRHFSMRPLTDNLLDQFYRTLWVGGHGDTGRAWRHVLRGMRGHFHRFGDATQYGHYFS